MGFGSGTEAGFRCSVVGGFLNIFSGEAKSAACSASCVTLGHTSGICDSDGECHCSKKSIDLDGLMELIPSRCDLGEEFAKCGAEETCRVYCQANGSASGECR